MREDRFLESPASRFDFVRDIRSGKQRFSRSSPLGGAAPPSPRSGARHDTPSWPTYQLFGEPMRRDCVGGRDELPEAHVALSRMWHWRTE